MRGVSLAAVAVVVSLSACKKEESAPAPSAPPKAQVPSAPAAAAAAPAVSACSLLAPADVLKVTGVAVKEGQSTGDQASSSQCGWSRVTGSEEGVSITLYTSNAAGVFDSFSKLPGNDPAPGVGDKATWDGSGLIALKGDKAFNLTFNFAGVSKEKAIELAKVVAGKL